MLARALILLLMCMNIGVSIWWISHREPVPVLKAASDPGVSSLVLLRESGRQPVAADAELSAAPEPLDAGSVCMSIGPFDSPGDLRRAMNRLLPSVERIQFREVAAVELRGYRVFLPAAGNRADALQAARALANKGISDYYVVTAGDQQNTVSLGLFRDLDNAEARRATVAAIGYNPSIEPRTEQVAQWWIDLAADPGFNWQEALPEPKLRAVTAACS